MALAAPPPARLKARTEFSITLHVPHPAPAGISHYRFEYREACEPSWDKALRIDTKPGDTDVVLDDLNPTSSYEIRIYALSNKSDGQQMHVSPPSEVAAVDTDVPGCTPDSKCSIQ